VRPKPRAARRRARRARRAPCDQAAGELDRPDDRDARARPPAGSDGDRDPGRQARRDAGDVEIDGAHHDVGGARPLGALAARQRVGDCEAGEGEGEEDQEVAHGIHDVVTAVGGCG
jgi:hypothetical protein